MPWRRALIVWLLLVAVETVHGTLRTVLLVPLIGDRPARQLAVLTGSLLIVLVAWLTIRWLQPLTRRAVLLVGLLWLGLMLCFELLVGRLVAGLSWARIADDYDLPHGGLLPLGMLVLAAAPWIACRLRRCLPAA